MSLVHSFSPRFVKNVFSAGYVQSNETLDLASDQGFGGGPDRLESLAQEDAMDAPERLES